MPPFLRVSALLGSSSQCELAREAACGVCAGEKGSCQLELQVTVPWELHKGVLWILPSAICEFLELSLRREGGSKTTKGTLHKD